MNSRTKLQIGAALVLVIYLLLHAIVFAVADLFYNIYLGYVAIQDVTVVITSTAWSQPVELPMSALYALLWLGGSILGTLALCLSVPFIVEFWRKKADIPQLWWYKTLVTGKWRE